MRKRPLDVKVIESDRRAHEMPSSPAAILRRLQVERAASSVYSRMSGGCPYDAVLNVTSAAAIARRARPVGNLLSFIIPVLEVLLPKGRSW